MGAFKGIIPPVLTTFDSEGNIDEKRYLNLIDFLSRRVHGLFVCGTYGGGPLMTVDERKKVTELAIKGAADRVPVIAHIGSSNPNDIFELAKHAEQAGAKAVATVVPFYFPYSQADIVRFFKKLIETTALPVFIYNNPKTTGVTIDIETLKKLRDVGLYGIKDSTFDLLYFYGVKFNMDMDNFCYISGTEAFIIPSIPLGADAAICGLANALPEPVVELYEKSVEGNYEKALELQLRVNKLRDIQHYAQSIPAIHAMLKMRGIDSGYPRHPYSLVSDSVYQKIEDALKEMKAL
ncbi:MAG: dihydrodipicolinate synthase family protein [Mesotoga sp.]|jgi:dihydrodipicolinate synthase/N-acetylneuraminate lyase|uniref:dihydrodipicolinate synthase family protein n=1 Tax=unclassified Mesotoga TaxID=1184398 RepID=UPI000EF192C5|nr:MULTISPECIES: dihydrodipicolinate synthase family protein [unclassified Mesotoga]MDI9367099.1 dihydrodipicolinate synthase family protein [Thermotogota bacterium]NLT44880.1 dihydrodipicolinate synthase family protein [Thermotogaceae bacterium]MDD2332934.1 dihydrodipicolinate synthase family protein [Mesotoga sp.]MDD3680948.1 dihydrodipicolinate synthase family protein [Mesotoga sp.]MDD4206317.1 dihydrodipicolinate synthase family protein [Mesotoga sp.]